MASKQYFLRIDEEISGPFSSGQLRSFAENGKLPPSAEISSDRENWIAACNVKGLVFPAVASGSGKDGIVQAESRIGDKDDANSTPESRCDILISYRRQGGSEIARYVAENLRRQGYTVFLDVEGLGSGDWSHELETRIAQCKDFVPIITDGFFDRCDDPDDVVRMEIAHAIANKKNIVPLLATDHPFPSQLPSEIEKLPSFNGVRYVHEYAPKAVEKLCSMLDAGVGGPERLYGGEAQPRVIVAMVAMFLAAWQGSYVGRLAGDGPMGAHWGVYEATTNGLFWGLVLVVGLGIPVSIALSFLGSTLKAPANRFYAGPWIPFWLLFIPTIVLFSSVVTTAVFATLGIQSYFWGGVFGQLLGIGFVALVIKTKAWTPIREMIAQMTGG